MERKWVALGLVGAGAAVAVGVLAFAGKTEAAVPAAYVLTWQPARLINGAYPLQAGMIYGISDHTRNIPVSYVDIKKSFESEGFKVLDLVHEPPSGWPADDIEAGQAYLIFTQETDKTMPAAALGATGRLFVLA